MAISWISLLKAVPWKDVIATAPILTENAKKLWHSAVKKPSEEVAFSLDDKASDAPKVENITSLSVKLNALEKSVLALHKQILTTSELLKDLADQNNELIRRVEKNRKRIWWLFGVLTLAILFLAIELTVFK